MPHFETVPHVLQALDHPSVYKQLVSQLQDCARSAHKSSQMQRSGSRRLTVSGAGTTSSVAVRACRDSLLGRAVALTCRFARQQRCSTVGTYLVKQDMGPVHVGDQSCVQASPKRRGKRQLVARLTRKASLKARGEPAPEPWMPAWLRRNWLAAASSAPTLAASRRAVSASASS